MSLKVLIATFLAGLATLLSTPVVAERRVALVIGNAAYRETAPLKNTRNDAMDMIEALKRLNFEVLDGLDLDKRGMERLIRQFEQKLVGANVALFFYAGHGIQVSGQNHLVPIDARLAAEGDVDFESLPLSLVLSRMERTVKTSLVLLDACRDNPLARNLARNMGTRSTIVGQGLAEVKTGIGTLISFSTQPGNVALDGDGRNSPYTAALLKEIDAPGRDILSTLATVRGAVVKATNGKQVPWEHTSLLGSVMLREAPVQQPSTTTAPISTGTQEIAAREWQDVKGVSNIAVLQAFIGRHKADPVYGPLAQSRLEEIEQQRAREAAEAERQRLSLLDQQKRAEAEAKKRIEADAKAKAERETVELVRGLQTELTRLGCYKGKIDGTWGGSVVEAIVRYNSATKSNLGTSNPTKATLGDLINRGGTACPVECGRGETLVSGKCVAASPAPPPQKATVEKRKSVSDTCEAWQKCAMLARATAIHANLGSAVLQKCGTAPLGCAGP